MAIVLKPHQSECVQACKQNSYGTITDTCGAGKSYEEDELIFDAFDQAGENACIACYGAHRLDLINQQFSSLCRYGKDRAKPWIYNENQKDFVILEVSSAGRDGYDHTTTIEEIMNAIKGAQLRKEKLLIYFCFASAERLYAAFEKLLDFECDLLIADEAHYGQMSTNDASEDFNRHLFRNYSKRMYFFTATPTDLTLNYNGLKVMPVIHKYNYGDALADGNVLPFTVHWMIDKTAE